MNHLLLIIEEPEAKGGELAKLPLQLHRELWFSMTGLWLFSAINKYPHAHSHTGA